MKTGYRIALSMVGVAAVIATVAFIWISFVAPAGNRSASAGTAKVTKSPESPSPSPEAVVEAPSVEAPLVFDHPGSSKVAYSAYGKMQIHSSPNGKVSRTMDNPTREGMQLIFGVQEDRGDWLKVRLPIRPNGSTGWVKKSDVLVKTVPNHIVVETAKRKLTAWKGSSLLMEAPVGVGTDKTPTPPGTFYVDFSLRDPGPGYGVHMLSVSGFSNVLRNFAGGTGQLAIHGTEAVHTVGQFSSNGCLRLTNEDVTKLARLAPAGTPVFILP